MSRRPVVLDGGLATLLEAHGHDLSSSTWSARLLQDDPGAVQAAHAEYYRAGAEVAISASYQVSEIGFGAEADGLLRDSVQLARRARDEVAPHGWVAASVGPYGAALADGSEYTGRYDLDVAGLRAFHRPRLDVLREAGADVLAVETLPSLAEVEAVLAELDGSGHPAWLALTADGGRTRAGEPVAEAFAMAADVAEVVAVGVNCVPPSGVLASLDGPGRLPGVVYPNSGQTWDAEARVWVGEPGFDPTDVEAWLAAGARLVGGCCQTGPDDVRAIAASLESLRGER
nr:homocysteine S-methyltransferase [Nocardioides flavescens]